MTTNLTFDSGFLLFFFFCSSIEVTSSLLFFVVLQQFDGNGNLLHKIDTRLSATSYGEDELITLNQSYVMILVYLISDFLKLEKIMCLCFCFDGNK